MGSWAASTGSAGPTPPFLRSCSGISGWTSGCWEGHTGLSSVLVASLFGLIISGLFLPLAGDLNLTFWQQKLLVALCVLTVVCSWLMAHLAYCCTTVRTPLGWTSQVMMFWT